jgi:hypothetical protein
VTGPHRAVLLAQRLLQVLDVLIKGALLGGGAEAIHQNVSMFTTFMEPTKSRIKAAS